LDARRGRLLESTAQPLFKRRLVRTGLTSVRASYPSTCFGDNGLGFGFYAGLLDEVAIFNRPLADLRLFPSTTPAASESARCLSTFFLSQPTNVTANVGSTVTLSSLAGGTPPLSYQWTFSGTNIAGATTNTLTLANVQSSQAVCMRCG